MQELGTHKAERKGRQTTVRPRSARATQLDLISKPYRKGGKKGVRGVGVNKEDTPGHWR